jgi:hypothetical protein
MKPKKLTNEERCNAPHPFGCECFICIERFETNKLKMVEMLVEMNSRRKPS